MAPPSSRAESFPLLTLPVHVIEQIVLNLSYDEISRLRLVCRFFDKTCQGVLNSGFMAVEKYHGKCHRNVKALLPRRESERRTHKLARHCDIFNAVETRLSLLSMTFIKYIEMKLCCFIPGKVIDEIYRILRILQNKTSPPRAHEILQELRDISSMAMEHFDEKIVPVLKRKMVLPPHMDPLATSTITLPSFMGIPGTSQRDVQFSKWIQPGLLKLHHINKKNGATLLAIKKQHENYKLKISEIEKKVTDQEKVIVELNHVITDQDTKIVEQQEQINELSKKFLDYDKKFEDMFVAAGLGKVRPASVTGRKEKILRKTGAKTSTVSPYSVMTRSKHAKTETSNAKPAETVQKKNEPGPSTLVLRKRKASQLPLLPTKKSRATL